MNKLIAIVSSSALDSLNDAREISGGTDNIHDLKMYINAKGGCEVSTSEAMQLIEDVISDHEKIASLILDAREKVIAIAESIN